MNKLEALDYLIENEARSDEWAAAGMYSAVREIINSKDIDFAKEYLDKLIEEAYNF
jgi:hypothetical protein